MQGRRSGNPKRPCDAIYGQGRTHVWRGRYHAGWIHEIELIDDFPWCRAAVLYDGWLAANGQLAAFRAARHLQRVDPANMAGTPSCDGRFFGPSPLPHSW